MTRARAVIVAILATALGLGALMWWLQTRGLYREVLRVEAGDVGVVLPDGTSTFIPVADAQFLDSGSSPIRARACFTLADPASVEALAPYAAPTPLNAPGWFRCFDARAVGEALEAGEARAFLAPPLVDLPYGIDAVLAAFPDGRAVLWHQWNRCGEALYGGQAKPADCPDPPGGLRFDSPPGET